MGRKRGFKPQCHACICVADKIPNFRICPHGFSGKVGGVDLITQALLGAALGELVLGKRLGKRALAWGAFFGGMPELDVLLYPFIDTARTLAWHRGPSHSLLVMALGSFLISRGLAKRWKDEKVTRAQAGGFVFLVWSGHVLLDCFTIQGAAPLWPVSDENVRFNLLFHTDVLFLLTLLLSVTCLTFLRDEKRNNSRGRKPVPLAKGRRICRWGLGLSGAYALLAVAMKFTASGGFEADLARRGVKFERRMEAPMPYNIMLWRSVVDRGDEFWVGYRSAFEFHDSPVRWTIYRKGEEALAGVAEQRETKTLLAHSDGWWLARPHAKGAWLGDLRHPEARVWGVKKDAVDSRLGHSWVLDVSAPRERLRASTTPAQAADGFLRRMGARIIGKRDTWEANPRLAGVVGSLPEFLPVEE
jgi:inner membrane protein